MRLLGFALATFGIFYVGRLLPGIGALWQSLPILSLLVSAALAAVLIERFGERARMRRKARVQIRDLSQVDTPANRAKLGTALLAAGKARTALDPLAEARSADPTNGDLAWRHGQALLATGDVRGAIEALEAAVACDEELGYGRAQLDLAEAHERAGQHTAALEAVERFERNHGPSAESAYRRGALQKSLGDRDAARAALAEVTSLARSAPKYQRGEAMRWAAKASAKRLFS